MPAITLKIWLNLFNQVYRTGRIPPEWKQATVIPIPKPAFLEGRKIQVKVDGELSEIAITDPGTPQGSVISPTLFSLIVNGLPDAVKDSGMVISQFADDSGTWLKGSNM
ncbi:hypothetical protein DPMN_171503 [Dreissena polymorpha]|uniref:Reverse transcriptase domain-containing protein n=1 Tax=Dreissena polymorpha TaxID=45954 RepID=A0A9D4E1A5_DREPO|nr:hypothetical protein DPMN_171503 [Dreissena polymorpha]